MRKAVLGLMAASVLTVSVPAHAEEAQLEALSASAEVASPAPQSVDQAALVALHAPAQTPEATAGMDEYEAYLVAWAVGTLVYVMLLNSY